MAGPAIFNGNYIKFLKQALRLGSLSADPSSPAEGDFYYNSTSTALKYYNGSTWVTVPTSGASYTSTATKTSAYTILITDDQVNTDPSGGAFTVTLPSAATATKPIQIINVASSMTFNEVTIARNGADTIAGGTQNSINMTGESITLFPVGTDWKILERRVPSDWANYSLTIGGTTTAPTKGGTIQVDEARWRRVGDSIQVSYNFTQTSAGSAGSGIYLFPLPSGLTVDTNRINPHTGAERPVVGAASAGNSASLQNGYTKLYNTSNLTIVIGDDTNVTDYMKSTNVSLAGSSVFLSFMTAAIPITGFRG